MTDPTPPQPAQTVADKLARAGRLASTAGRDRLGQVRTRVRHRLERRTVAGAPAAGPFPPPDFRQQPPSQHAFPPSPDFAPPSTSVVPTPVHPAFYTTNQPVTFTVAPGVGYGPVAGGRHRALGLALAVAFIFPPGGMRFANKVREECRRERLRGEGVAMVAYLFSAINTLCLTLVVLGIAATFAYGMYSLGSGMRGVGNGLESIGEFLDWVRRGFS